MISLKHLHFFAWWYIDLYTYYNHYMIIWYIIIYMITWYNGRYMIYDYKYDYILIIYDDIWYIYIYIYMIYVHLLQPLYIMIIIIDIYDISTIFPWVFARQYSHYFRWPKRAMRCSCPRRPTSPWTPCGPAEAPIGIFGHAEPGWGWCVDGLMMNSGDIF